MRIVDSHLADLQASASKRPAMQIIVGDITFTMSGSDVGTTTCQNTDSTTEWVYNKGNRILSVHTYLTPWGKKPDSAKESTILLRNNDKFLYGLNLKGHRCSVCWGANTDIGPKYSADPPMYITNVAFGEQEGSMVCTLTMLGIMDWLAADEASCDYTCNGTDTIKVLTEEILASTLAPFSGQKAFRLQYDGLMDDNYGEIVPGPTFKIKKGDSRAYTLARLLDMTSVKLRPGNDPAVGGKDTIHALVPSTEITNRYTLDKDDVKFFAAGESTGIIRPNKIIVKSTPSESTIYTGIAKDNISYAAIPTERTEYIYGLANNEHATLVANTVLANIRVFYNASYARVPMHFGQELYDRVEIYSERTERTYTGTVTTIEKVYDPMKAEPRLYMNISFGKYYDPRSVADSMGIGAGFLGMGYSNVGDYIFIPPPAYVSFGGSFACAWICSYGYGLAIIWAASNLWVKFKWKIPSNSYKIRVPIFTGNNSLPAADVTIKVTIDDVDLSTKTNISNTNIVYDNSDNAFVVEDNGSEYHDVKLTLATTSGYEEMKVGGITLIPQ